MAQASVRVGVGAQGADLRTIARELKRMDDRKVKDIFKRQLEPVAERFVPLVRASALAIPVKAEGRHTGLRGRIAACAEMASWDSGPREVSVAVEIQPRHMPDREKGLPLYMEGIADTGRHDRWRHPVFGTEAQLAKFFATPRARRARGGHGRAWKWVTQDAHPYFYRAARGYGPASGVAMQRALDDITRQING